MLGRASRALRGLRPVRVATVAQALLRAFCGQLIEAKRARRLEQTIIRTICAGRRRAACTSRRRRADLAALAPSQLRALGLHTRRAAVARPALPHDRARAAARRRRRTSSPRASSASAGSGRGRSASSASKGSAATTTGSSATSASSSCCARCAAGRSRAGRRRSCSSRTASGRGSRACTCSPATRAALLRPRIALCAMAAHRDPRRRPHRRGAALGPAELGLDATSSSTTRARARVAELHERHGVEATTSNPDAVQAPRSSSSR